MTTKPGLYLTHKPRGVTSFSCVKAFVAEREAQGARKLPVCHGGTLDPFAEGLLLMLAGETTRLMDLHHALPKRYVAEVVWGAETDNGDPGGAVVETGDASGLTPARIEEETRAFLGWTEQVPPATSAKKIDGEPAYRKVHRGESVVLPSSRVFLHEASWVAHALPHRSTVSLVCRGGFYVRAFARDLGRRLGARAHLGALSRTDIGPWRDVGLEGPRVHLEGEALLPWMKRRRLTDAERGAVRAGKGIPLPPLEEAPWRVPAGFPEPEPLVAGFHLGKLVLVMADELGELRPTMALRYGL